LLSSHFPLRSGIGGGVAKNLQNHLRTLSVAAEIKRFDLPTNDKNFILKLVDYPTFGITPIVEVECSRCQQVSKSSIELGLDFRLPAPHEPKVQRVKGQARLTAPGPNDAELKAREASPVKEV